MKFVSLPTLQPGDKIGIVSPSFAAPGAFPEVFELGLSRLRDVFGLTAESFPSTAQLGASPAERSRDLVAAFSRPDIKAVIA